MHATVCDYLLDLAQNSIEAGAAAVIVELEQCGADLILRVSDDGRGMDAEELRRALDPFYTDGKKHPGRKVGLGLPFLKQAAEAAGGQVDLSSEKGTGTSVFMRLQARHVDAPPLGDVPGTAVALLGYPGNHELVFVRRREGRMYRVSRQEILEQLGTLDGVAELAAVREFLEALENEVQHEVEAYV